MVNIENITEKNFKRIRKTLNQKKGFVLTYSPSPGSHTGHLEGISMNLFQSPKIRCSETGKEKEYWLQSNLKLHDNRSYLLRQKREYTDFAWALGASFFQSLSLEGYAATHTMTDVSYFSPAYLYSVYLVPMVEHTWYKRYQEAFISRLYFGLGAQWQKSFS